MKRPYDQLFSRTRSSLLMTSCPYYRVSKDTSTLKRCATNKKILYPK